MVPGNTPGVVVTVLNTRRLRVRLALELWAQSNITATDRRLVFTTAKSNPFGLVSQKQAHQMLRRKVTLTWL